jgi:hypothetical protein
MSAAYAQRDEAIDYCLKVKRKRHVFLLGDWYI